MRISESALVVMLGEEVMGDSKSLRLGGMLLPMTHKFTRSARQDEIRNKKRKLFPISLVPFNAIRAWSAFDADVGKDVAREVREYFIPDFSNWKDHDAYQKAFDRLLLDLKASEETGLD